MLQVTEVADAQALVGAVWRDMQWTLFPLSANSHDGLRATWQACADWPTDHLLMLQEGQTVVAGCGVFVGEDECRFTALVADPFAPVATALTSWVTENHPGSAVSIGIDARDRMARTWLMDNGFSRREDSIVMTTTAAEGGPLVTWHTPRVESNWADLHDTLAGDIYWTAERVAADADNWLCVSKDDSYAAARVGSSAGGVREAEVFVAGGPDSALAQTLRGLRTEARRAGASEVVFFCDRSRQGAAEQAGFKGRCGYEDWTRPAIA